MLLKYVFSIRIGFYFSYSRVMMTLEDLIARMACHLRNIRLPKVVTGVLRILLPPIVLG
jgi:hypothetical protein